MRERCVGKTTRKIGWKTVILRPVNKEEMSIIQCWECGQEIEINTTLGRNSIK
jgi:hypothetical protein